MSTRDRHTRIIAFLKVVLPLAALALLCTLFLLSRAIRTHTTIPFAETEIQERLRDQQITGPFFSGTTTNGDQMSFSAKKLVTVLGRIGANRAEDVKVEVKTNSGSTYQMQAQLAELDISDSVATLSGDVSINSSTGYNISTDNLTVTISDTELASTEPIKATGPVGSLTAGSFRIFTPKSSDSAQMLFSGGVMLVYTPNRTRK
ncbi:MAG: LPS export ABC transporter periplasmic protein LptC [Sulfitobacter sp.]